MNMRKLLEAMSKFAGETEQRAGEQWKGTDKGTPGKKLVGDSIIKDLAKGLTPKTKEEELAEAWANFMEDDLGVEPKRPARKGSRHARGHEPKSGYTTVKADEEVDEGRGDSKGLHAKVTIVKGPDAGKTGYVRQIKTDRIRNRVYLDLDLEDGGQAVVLKQDVRLVKEVKANEGWAQDSADAQRSLSAAAIDRVLQKYQDDPELSAIANFMSRNNWTAQSIDDTMQGRGKFDIDWWKNTMAKNLPETKHKQKDAVVYESIESTDPVEGAVLAAVQELIQQGHTEVAPEVITNMVVAATSQPFLLKDLVDVNNNSAAVQHYVDSINPAKVKFSNEILTVKNEDPLKDKKAAQAGVSNMAARAAGRNRLGESSHASLRDQELARRKAELVQQAKKLGIDESRAHKIITNKLKQIELQRKISGDRESDDERNIRMAKQQQDYIKNNPNTIFKRDLDEYGANQPTGTAGQSAIPSSKPADSAVAAKQLAAANTLKTATGTTAAPADLGKALDSATAGTATSTDVKALAPIMGVLNKAAQDPKLANQFKTLANQAKTTS